MPAWMDDDLAARRTEGLYRQRRRLASGQGAEVRYRHADYVNFSSNDYLALAGDPRLVRAACRATQRYGTGAGASSLVSGYHPALQRLERDLAAWEGCEATLVFSSGFMTNVALLSTLVGRDDAIFSDAHNHASLIDGCRLAHAATHVYRHNDLGHLDELLARYGPAARRRLVVSDTVFSMDGDLCDLAGLLARARQHDALLVIDEAHASGVLGQHGRGLTDALPEADARDERLLKVGTLSKALGSQGGFVCGTRQLIDWLINHARPYIFSTALAPPAAAAARRAVFLVGQEPQRRQHLLALAQELRQRLVKIGLNVGPSAAHIVPVIVGEPEAAVALSRRLESKRLLVPAIRPPSVPVGTSRLRISLSAGHTEEDVQRLADALAGA